ncbi:MAG: GTPase Der [Melioribacteraceae bacterium]|nr:MAG: GTPase Der [Melioribacteraceae bacterium]
MPAPLVAIVGRPNVGKSTLFNRLTGQKNAIVDDISGVTRDRIYGEVEWSGKKFRLIDTGGYVPDSDDRFESAIREQVQIAVEEADTILFVTDGRLGISPIDHVIANLLHKYEKPVFLLANKLDMSEMAYEAADFYSLGMDRVIDIAAISGRNLGDFLDELIDTLKFPEAGEDEDTRLRIALVGRPNVGKSSLTNALLGIERSIVTEIPGTTRDSIDSVIKYYGEEIVLVDTAGLRRKSRIKENVEFYSTVRTFKAIMDSDVAVLMLDAEVGLEKQDMRILEEAIRRRKGIIIAINKWDLIEKETNTAYKYEQELREKLSIVDYAPVIFISALTKQRIYKLLDLAKKIAAERAKKITTKQLNDTLLPELGQTPPPSTPNGKEIKIRYITQVGEYYPIFLFFANDAKYIPDSYRRFVEKLIRKHFGYEGCSMTLSFRDK